MHADTAAYTEDWRRLYRGRTPAVIRPASTEELARVVRLCAEARAPIVPQGGNTSMVGGATPAEDGSEFVLSLSRLTRIRDIDPLDLTMTIEAGVTLKAAQTAAAEAGCLLPLSISSEGSAQIGGVLATNAGGNNTVRYGNARDLVLGLEVVLPDGTVWNGLRRLRKDNTGYCLRQLFVGSEGTLGIITAAVLKLVPRPREIVRGAVRRRLARGGADAVRPLPVARSGGDQRLRVDVGPRHRPRAAAHRGCRAAAGLRRRRTTCWWSLPRRAPTPVCARRWRTVLEAGTGRRHRADAVIAESEAQRAAIWRLREEHSEAQKREGASVKNDVSVPVSKVPEFIRRATAACEALMPGIRAVPFGHMGDGNIHFNLVQPVDADPAWFLAQDHAIMDTVNEVVRALDGSFSAEHGIGRLKPYMMPDWRGGAELAVMRRIKAGARPAGHHESGEGAAVATAVAGSYPSRGGGRGRGRPEDTSNSRLSRLLRNEGAVGDPGLAQPDRHRGSAARHPRGIRRLRPHRAGRTQQPSAVRPHGGSRRHRASLLVLRTRAEAARSLSRQRGLLSAAATSPPPARAWRCIARRRWRWRARRSPQLDIAAERGAITHLIVASCTGFTAPGLDFDIMQDAGLAPSVERTIVGFMGCFAAVNALKLARHIVRSEAAREGAGGQSGTLQSASAGTVGAREDAELPAVRRRLRRLPGIRRTDRPRARSVPCRR